MIEEAVGIGGLCRLFTKPDGSVPSFQEVVANHREDPRLSAYLEQAIPELALLFANVTWLLDPKTIIVETPYSKLDPQFIDKLREAFETLLLPQRGDFMPELLPNKEEFRTACYKGAGLAILERYFTIWSDKDNLEDWLKGKGLRKRLFYGVGFARTTGQGMNRNGRTQFAPTAGFASAEGWDTSRKRANTVRPYATQKKISTTQRTFLQRKRKFPACTVVHAGNPVIHRNPSITPFQGRVSGMGGRHPDKPPPHSHWATTGRKLPMQTRLTFPPVDKAETWSAHFRKLFLLRPRHSSTPNPPCNLSISISANMSCADSFNG